MGRRTRAPPWAGCGSTTRASLRERPRQRWASASCGFLAPAREIIQERLEREFNLNLIDRAVGHHKIKLIDGKTVDIHNPVDMPDVVKIRRSRSRGSAPRSSRRTNISQRAQPR
jgi:hypothetical protein